MFIATKFFVAQTYYFKFYCNTSHQLLQWIWYYCNDFSHCNKHFFSYSGTWLPNL